ncbi:hypothetical protein [Adhaeribacter aquaticus]|uniref:hypothetical protein n=1 Tax=Adhaeribacter aquaticus TaxID=299567 RepID=UPI000401B03D|nr:hypothetical protein [Adhaeribacter aquaticus]
MNSRPNNSNRDEDWNLEENQRRGREIARERGNERPQDQYRSGQNYHNRNEGYSSEQTHYGSRPDSAYRDPNRINYGDNRGQNQNNWQRSNQNSQYNTGYRNNLDNDKRGRDFDNPPLGDHGGTRYWGERDQYKEDDYRYTSGHRGDWHTPGTSSDQDYDNRRRDNRYNQSRNQDEGMFDRMGNSISRAWDNFTEFFDENNNNRNSTHTGYRPDPNYQNRNQPRGYESGPRWADESDRHRYDRDRQNRRRDHDDDRY